MPPRVHPNIDGLKLPEIGAIDEPLLRSHQRDLWRQANFSCICQEPSPPTPSPLLHRQFCESCRHIIIATTTTTNHHESKCHGCHINEICNQHPGLCLWCRFSTIIILNPFQKRWRRYLKRSLHQTALPDNESEHDDSSVDLSPTNHNTTPIYRNTAEVDDISPQRVNALLSARRGNFTEIFARTNNNNCVSRELKQLQLNVTHRHLPENPPTPATASMDMLYPLTAFIRPSDVFQLQQLCQETTSQKKVINVPRLPDCVINAARLQALLTPHQQIGENILTAFLEASCSVMQGVFYFDNTFYTWWKDEGWTKASKLLYNGTSRIHHISVNRPCLSIASALIILIHVLGNHWVIVVRKKHSTGHIAFYYADDLNLPRVASEVKQQFLGSRSDPIFCPPTAEWVVCPTTTYHPHQNECGARAVLHGVFIAYHPDPHKNMLMPLMHPNLACNTRA